MGALKIGSAALGLLLVGAAVGCGPGDPCGGKSGVCIGITVQGSAGGLDQLALTVDKPMLKTITTPSTPAPFSLPARVALILPAGTTGTVQVACDGMHQHQIVAHDQKSVALVNGRAQLTCTLDSGSAPAGSDLALMTSTSDLAGSDASTSDGGTMGDLSACSTVSACSDGDGCCPAGCNNASDHDCPAVCGNNIVETGEVCDDGNSANGDACDPTCKWANVMTTLSGAPGSAGYATGPDSRFETFGGLTSDGTNLYVSDISSATIRIFPIIAPSGTSLFAGRAYDAEVVNGPIAGARFDLGGGDGSMVSLGGILYMVDFDLGGANLNVLRSISATTVATVAAVVQPSMLATDGTFVYFSNNNGDIMKWMPGTSSSSIVVAAATISAALGSAPFITGMTFYNGALYITAGHGIAKVTTAGAVSLLTGSLDSSKAGCSGTTTANATWGSLGHLTNDGGGNLYVPDPTCCAIRYVALIGSTVGVYAGTLGSCGNVDAATFAGAKFGQPTDIYYKSGQDAYVLDSGNSTIRVLSAIGGSVTTMGASPNVHAAAARGSGSASRYTSVVAMDSDGTKIYALGSPGGAPIAGNVLMTVTLADGTSTDTPASWTSGTAIVKIGAKLYVGVNDGTIHSVNLDGSSDAIVAGMSGATYPPGDGSAGSPLSAVLNPTAFATDGTDLYFVDKANLIRKLTLATSTVSTIAGTQSSMDVIDGTGGGAHFAGAQSLVYSGGMLYTLDGVLNPNSGFVAPILVRRITLSTREVKTIAGQIGTIGSNDGIGLAAQFSGALFLGTDGRSLFISDADESFNFKSKNFQPTIRQLDLNDLSVTTMLGTRGQWTIHNGVGTAALLNQPGPIVFDGTTHTLVFYDRAEGVFQRVR